ncbi:MAG: DUF4127 family protein [Anaerolineae bacterium]|nr:DUF4127 family protein [Anaerolineae bacterium]
MNIVLLPLDERPVNTRYPALIAGIAGVELWLPPPHLLSQLRRPADRDGLLRWLREVAPQADAVIVSVESFAAGGLIASRTTDEDTGRILGYLEALAGLTTQPLTAFNVITRLPDADDAVEEPDYWAQYGRRLHRYSQLLHRRAAGQPVQPELDALAAELPPALLADLMQRRLRNHTVNLHVLGLAARGVLDLLVLSSDDTSEYGLGSQEKAWLRTWAGRLALDDQRLLMYPGADEIGCVLVMRAVLRGQGQPAPTFYVHYAIEADRERIAPYEDSPIAITVERQIRALGGLQTEAVAGADFIVAVNPPSRIGQEYDPEVAHFAAEHARRAPYLHTFSTQISAWVAAGRRVIVADVAYPNGSDPDLVARLLAQVDLRRLAAYGAWNTAGNSIGTALAQGVAAARATTPAQQQMQQRFLLHRFIEDWGYQHLVRPQIRAALHAETGRPEVTPASEAATTQRIHAALTALLPQLQPLAAGWHLGPVRLPWQRTFEIDFDLEWRP